MRLPKSRLAKNNPQQPSNPIYHWVRIRVIAVLYIIDGLMMLLIGHYAPRIALRAMSAELRWQARRRDPSLGVSDDLP